MSQLMRLYIEADQKLDEDEIETVTGFCTHAAGLPMSFNPEHFFHQIIINAVHEGDSVWEAVKAADEIYVSTALIPLVYGGNFGSPSLFNSMMYKVIEENVRGKKLFMCGADRRIWWSNIKQDWFKKAFRHNALYLQTDEGWQRADINQISETEW